MRFLPGDRVTAVSYSSQGTIVDYMQQEDTPIVRVHFDDGRDSYFYEHSLTMVDQLSPLQSRVRAYLSRELAP